MNHGLLTAFSATLLLLHGCATGPRYACGAPDGVGCKPVSTVYEESVTHVLEEPNVVVEPGGGAFEEASPEASPPAEPVVETIRQGTPLISSPRILRVWVAPWEDRSGDPHDETFLYLRLDEGRWLLGK